MKIEPKITLYVHHKQDNVNRLVVDESKVETAVTEHSDAPVVIACNPFKRTNTYYAYGKLEDEQPLT